MMRPRAEPPGLSDGADDLTKVPGPDEPQAGAKTRDTIGDKIGRFVVLERLGQGGMGAVYAGYDDRLDRRIALKVLRDQSPKKGGSKGERLWREAQTMARISHPNVVKVHEVGRVEGSVYVVMEFIRGQTLKDWHATRRAWQEVVGAYVAAGQGLRAAHELGLVHRDFKPANVMRSEDGHIKVLDFGLARAVGTGTRAERAHHKDGGAKAAEPWSVMGTVPYMSPEQQQGGEVDERSDQYSYCVALWLGLTGTLPFRGDRADVALAAKIEGPPRWPKEGSGVPGRVVAAVQRGLAVNPEARWPSMEALLKQLDWDPDRRRRRKWNLGLVGSAAAGLGGLAAQGWAQERGQRCSGAEERLAGVWDEARREAAKSAVLGVGVPYAAQVWSRTERGLTDYAKSWVQMHMAACEAGGAYESARAQMDAQMRCLHQAQVSLGAAMDTFVNADEQVLEKAHRVVGALRPLAWCEDPHMLEGAEAPPLPQEAEAVQEARKVLARAWSERAAGRPEAAWKLVEAADTWLRGVEYGPALTERAQERGEVQKAQGKNADAEASYAEAMELALAHDLEAPFLHAVSSLMYVVGVSQQKMEQGLLYWRVVRRRGRSDEALSSRVPSHLGQILAFQGRYPEAEAALTEAIRIHERLHPDGRDGDTFVAQARNNLGLVYMKQGKYAEAEFAFRVAVQGQQRALGPGHPGVAGSRSNLGNLLRDQGRYEEAEEQLRLSLKLLEDALGPETPEAGAFVHNLATLLYVQSRLPEAEAAIRRSISIEQRAPGREKEAPSRSMLSAILLDQGRFEEALGEARAAVRLGEKHLGPSHPGVAAFRVNRGMTLDALGQHEDAALDYAAALSIWERTVGPEHPYVAQARMNLAVNHADAGRFEDAEVEYRQALSIRENALGPAHLDVAVAQLGLGQMKAQVGLVEEALPWVRLAWERFRKADALPEQRAEAAFSLAQVLWSVGQPLRDRARARKLAQDAAAAYRLAGAGVFADDLREVEAWLASPGATAGRGR